MADRDNSGKTPGAEESVGSSGTPPPGTQPASGKAPAPGRSGTQPASGNASATGAPPASAKAPASTGRSGTQRRSARAGRRDHDRLTPVRRSFLERYRTILVVVAGISIAGVLAGVLLVQTTAKAYACGSILAPAASSDPAALGQVASDLGRSHVKRGTSVRFAYCPPTSGAHYNDLPDGPIPAQFYPSDRTTLPQGWVHNLEHGGIAVLYSCTKGTCADADLAPLRSYVQSGPASPLCGRTDALLATRFDDLPTPYAVVGWDRVLYLPSLDLGAVATFYAQRGDKGPELQCAQAAPGASLSPAASAAPSGSTAP